MKQYDSENENIKEVRAARQALWAEYGFDVNKVFEAMKKKEDEGRKQGRKYADDLQTHIPADFEERLQRLRAQKDQGSAAA